MTTGLVAALNLGFIDAAVFLAVVVFLEETFGVAVFLAAGLGAAFTLDFTDVAVLVFLVAGFFTALAVVVFFDFSPAEDGFLDVVALLWAEAAGFL